MLIPVPTRSRSWMLACLLASLALPVEAAAQVQAGRIVGTVHDPSKAVLPNASIVVTDVATNLAVTVVTDERGGYVVTPLNPGVYRVTVTSPGFQTTVVNPVEVQIGQSARVNVELSLGTVTENTVVTSDTPLLDTESGTLGHVVTKRRSSIFLLNGRSFYELARLSPGRGAAARAAGSCCAFAPTSFPVPPISGVRGSQTTFLLDGVDVIDHHQGGSLIQTSVDALQVFRVQQSAYSVEFSQSAGTLNATINAGSVQFHGVALRLPAQRRTRCAELLRARDRKAQAPSVGGTLGGPIFRMPHTSSLPATKACASVRASSSTPSSRSRPCSAGSFAPSHGIY